MKNLLHLNVEMKHDAILPCILLPFLSYIDQLELVGVIDCLVQYIYHMISPFVCGLTLSLFAVRAGSSIEHSKGVYLVLI